MLPRQQRFLLRQYSTFFQHALRASTSCVTGFYRPSATFSATVIVPKKVAPLAVGRHRIKRLIYQSLRNLQVKDEFSLVISVKKGCKSLQLEDWQNEIEQLLSKIRKTQQYDSASNHSHKNL